ncbi:MAG TPA: succinate dehydrogenase, hydrophobic membrane anchor protein [Xanthobacteraceae bacterium]|jgi:succinate dehydrogenase / fumarate reductase membrane anchor subunit
MRSSLRNVRGLGSARSGTEHFWLLRLTTVANIPLIAAVVVILVALSGRPHAAVIATLGRPTVAILMLAMLLSVIVHMRLGMQTIIEDYVHSEGRKIVLLMANTFFSIAIGLASAFAVFRISFGL